MMLGYDVGYHVHALVCGAIIHDDDLKVFVIKALFENAFNTRPDVFFDIVDGDYNR